MNKLKTEVIKVNTCCDNAVKKKAEQHSVEIELKNKELVTYALTLVKKNTVIEKTIDKLYSISSKTIHPVKSEIDSLINDLKSIQKSNCLTDFEIYFEKVHESFYIRLKVLFPELTPNEKNLCAYIRLNLVTKDISSITQQSIKSIEVARTRLRQKMKLTRNENLNTFIANI